MVLCQLTLNYFKGDSASRIPRGWLVHARLRDCSHLCFVIICCYDDVRGHADDPWQSQLREKVHVTSEIHIQYSLKLIEPHFITNTINSIWQI